jgi:hypothetical protein
MSKEDLEEKAVKFPSKIIGTFLMMKRKNSQELT